MRRFAHDWPQLISALSKIGSDLEIEIEEILFEELLLAAKGMRYTSGVLLVDILDGFLNEFLSEISKAYPIKPDEFESDAQLNRLSWTDLFVIGQAFQEQNAYDFCSLWLGKFMTSFDVRNHFF